MKKNKEIHITKRVIIYYSLNEESRTSHWLKTDEEPVLASFWGSGQRIRACFHRSDVLSVCGELKPDGIYFLSARAMILIDS